MATASGLRVNAPSSVTTFLFTDIEHSSRLWEQSPERMAPSLARHDALARAAVVNNRGVVVKMTGDGMHAVFEDPRDAMCATVDLQQALNAPIPPSELRLRVRCGLHAGVVERRDNDYFGNAVNRAARIMAAAHGGQILVSRAVADLVDRRLPPAVRLRDLGDVRLRDLASPEHLFQLLHPKLEDTFPPLRSLETLPNNLPQSTTSFVGRERELSEIRALLDEARLLTLHGAGGIGKTRLSLQVAADRLAEFADGAWFIDLASLADAERVPQAVASVLGVKEEAGRPIIEALIRSLRDRSLLLVLDNCEHLIRACAQLAADILRAAPHVKILATSREPLAITGEATYPVPALALPRPDERLAVDAVSQFEGVRLFVERAKAVAPSFVLTPNNTSVVVAICHRLDGIPLALELAAARVRALPVEDIAARLSDRFSFLVRGDRTALPRQQTLRALIDWSHDLLPEDERTFFRRLAVFAGGWTLAAAESVGADDRIDRAMILDLHSQLVEKSLIAMEAEGGRYRLLETVRHYALEQLDRSEDGTATRARHLDYYVAFAEEARTNLIGPGEAEWLPQLDQERENLLAAHAFCDRYAPGAEAGLRLASALKPYLFNRGMLGLAHRITVEALARPWTQAGTAARCRSLFDAGQICYFMGHYGEAVSSLEQSLVLARALDDSRAAARALQPLGLAYMGRGDMTPARRYLEEALALAKAQGDRRQLAGALNSFGQLRRVEGALDAASPLYAEMLAIAQELGDQETVAIGLLNLAMVDIARGAIDVARERLLQVLAIAAETGSKPAGQSVVEVCAGMAALRGEWARTARFFGSAEQQTTSTGIHRDPADEAFLAPFIESARKSVGADAFAAAEAAGRALSYDEVIAEASGWLASAV